MLCHQTSITPVTALTQNSRAQNSVINAYITGANSVSCTSTLHVDDKW